MKKILVVLLVLTVIGATVGVFVGCSNVNQLNMLSIGWLDSESFEYDVYYVDGDSTQLIGNMTYAFKRLNNANESINDNADAKKYEVSSGGYAEYNLSITDGDYSGSSIYSKVIFNSTFSPYASYKKFDSSDDSLDYEVFADYSGKKKGTVTVNGQEKTFKKVAGTYDNESLYTVIRGSVFETNSYSLSMRVPSNQTADVQTVSVVRLNANDDVVSNIVDGNGNKIKLNCSTFRASVPAKYGSGTYTVISFTNNAYDVSGKKVIKVPVMIQEGNYRYVIKSVIA